MYRQFSDLRLNSLGKFSRLLFIRAADEHRKPITIETCTEVSGPPQRTHDRVADLPKHRIGRVPTEKSPIFGKRVDSENNNAKINLLAAGDPPITLNRFSKNLVIGYARCGVSAFQVLELPVRIS